MRKPRPYYMVLRRASETSPVYVFATVRKFIRYSEAELYTQGLAVTSSPIIVMIG